MDGALCVEAALGIANGLLGYSEVAGAAFEGFVSLCLYRTVTMELLMVL